MNEVYTITSDRGDEYKLQFTTDRSGVISDAFNEEPMSFPSASALYYVLLFFLSKNSYFVTLS